MALLFHKHIGQLNRNFRTVPEVQSIGHNPKKEKYISFAHPTLNFSFILNGCGKLIMNKKEWEVTAPCVITQWPKVHTAYGPTPPHKHWNELFIAYNPETVDFFKKCKFADLQKPVWPIHDIKKFSMHREELNKLLRNKDLENHVDEIDLCSVGMIMASLKESEAHPEPENETEEYIRKIQNHVHKNYLTKIDFDKQAKANGLSFTSFRRHWTRLIGYSPKQYVINLRLQEARRLLVETGMNIGNISNKTGFDDPLYFSRLFRKNFNLSPRQYRAFHKQTV